MMGRPVILDTTVLTNFAKANCSEVLFKLWAEMVCTVPDVINVTRFDMSQEKIYEHTPNPFHL